MAAPATNSNPMRVAIVGSGPSGFYAAEADLTPWSTPFTPDALTLSAPFEITGCSAPRFLPSLEVGTTSNQAGGYSPMSVTFSRQDADQQLGGITLTTPPGLSGTSRT